MLPIHSQENAKHLNRVEEHCEGVKVPPQELSHKIGDHFDPLCGDA